MIIVILRAIYATAAVLFTIFFLKDIQKNKSQIKKEKGNPYIVSTIGAVVNFSDALGIGSFAIATVLLRFFKQIPDRLLPGTLNVMCILPTLAEAFIYIGLIRVDYLTFILMVVAGAFGGWFGARYVVRLPERKIQIAMSIALFFAGTVMLLRQTDLFPIAHGANIGLRGIKLIIATILSPIIGSLCNIGIGCYAPFLALAYLLGMNAKSAFPIMMTTAAACSIGSSITFIRYGAYSRKVTAYMAFFGVFGVIIAAFIVKSLPLDILTWLVMGVIYYAALSLFLATGIPQRWFNFKKP